MVGGEAPASMWHAVSRHGRLDTHRECGLGRPAAEPSGSPRARRQSGIAGPGHANRSQETFTQPQSLEPVLKRGSKGQTEQGETNFSSVLALPPVSWSCYQPPFSWGRKEIILFICSSFLRKVCPANLSLDKLFLPEQSFWQLANLGSLSTCK